MLCALLRSTGLLGRPGEVLRSSQAISELSHSGDPIAEIIARTSTPNGVYGLKVFSSHFELSRKLGWAEGLPNLHFIHLVRNDLLGQAISLAKALQTGRYKQATPSPQSPSYDRRAINDCLARLSYGDARWRSYFARNGIVPLRIAYEDVVRNPQGTVDRIAAELGIDPAPRVDLSQVQLGVQRDRDSERWRRRFVGECRDPGYLDGGLLLSRLRGAGRIARLILGGGSGRA